MFVFNTVSVLSLRNPNDQIVTNDSYFGSGIQCFDKADQLALHLSASLCLLRSLLVSNEVPSVDALIQIKVRGIIKVGANNIS